ncbi:MAG: DUF1501 domain-containing protein, partial [Planctomycetaceae bacterium]
MSQFEMDPTRRNRFYLAGQSASRRRFMQCAASGFGLLALTEMLARSGVASGTPTAPHHSRRARNAIFLFMDGGPSHVDTFDPKPALRKHSGKEIGKQAVSKRSQSSADRVWLESPWEFAQHGQSGLWVSDLLPHIATRVDDMCVVRSMVGELPLHGQQNLLLHTGRITGLAPSLGSWVSYGLGSDNENLPGYVLLNNDWIPNGGWENFSSAFLPAPHEAVLFRAKGDPVDNIVPRDSPSVQRRKVELLAAQDRLFAGQTSDRTAIESAIRNYETAFRMQSVAPQVADISRETPRMQRMYGVDSKDEHQSYYARQCLRARRLVEAGVRFVEITCPQFDNNNSPWDQHGKLRENHAKNARVTDQSVAALIGDLKSRGLLEETVVVWAGEMGRTPHAKSRDGRDHHVDGYSIFLAGGGFQGGLTFGATDEFGNTVSEHPLTIHDIHATILHQLGLDHQR